MNKYKTLKEFTIPAVEATEANEAVAERKVAVDEVVEMDEAQATPLVEDGTLEASAE